jgi:hypothetical protein
MEKLCTSCNLILPYDSFWKSNARKDGRDIHCRLCRTTKRNTTHSFVGFENTELKENQLNAAKEFVSRWGYFVDDEKPLYIQFEERMLEKYGVILTHKKRVYKTP